MIVLCLARKQKRELYCPRKKLQQMIKETPLTWLPRVVFCAGNLDLRELYCSRIFPVCFCFRFRIDSTKLAFENSKGSLRALRKLKKINHILFVDDLKVNKRIEK